MAEKRALTPREDNARRVLRTLMGVLDVNDAEMSQRISTKSERTLSRAAVQQRRNGVKPLDLRDLEECAAALNVPVELFDKEPIAAAQWVLDNCPDLLIGATGCFHPVAA